MKHLLVPKAAIACALIFLSPFVIAQIVESGAAASPASPKAEADKFLQRDMFKMHFPKLNMTYQTFPKEGYTLMTGWNNPCGKGKIATSYSVSESGELTVAFTFEDKYCPKFKYVFSGRDGQIYLFDKFGNWELRELRVEIVD